MPCPSVDSMLKGAGSDMATVKLFVFTSLVLVRRTTMEMGSSSATVTTLPQQYSCTKTVTCRLCPDMGRIVVVGVAVGGGVAVALGVFVAVAVAVGVGVTVRLGVAVSMIFAASVMKETTTAPPCSTPHAFLMSVFIVKAYRVPAVQSGLAVSKVTVARSVVGS